MLIYEETLSKLFCKYQQQTNNLDLEWSMSPSFDTDQTKGTRLNGRWEHSLIRRLSSVSYYQTRLEFLYSVPQLPLSLIKLSKQTKQYSTRGFPLVLTITVRYATSELRKQSSSVGPERSWLYV